MNNFKIYAHYIVHILLASAIVILLLVRPSVIVNHTGESSKKNSELARDTVYKDTTIYVTAYIPVPEIREVKVVDTVYRDSIQYIDTSSYVAHYYSDSIKQNYGIVYWSAVTAGELLALDAKYKGTVAEKIIYKEKDVIKHRSQLLLTSAIGYNGDNVRAGIGLELITKRGKKFGYEFDFVNKYHSITTGLRLF